MTVSPQIRIRRRWSEPRQLAGRGADSHLEGAHLHTHTAVATKQALWMLFLRTLKRISLRRVIPEKVNCRDGVLEVGGERIDLTRYRRVVGVAFGKAGFEMAELVAEQLSPLTFSGVVSGVSDNRCDLPGVSCFQGSHPYPDRESLGAGDAVVELMKSVTPDDLVIYLLSGGGSAVCEKPVSPDISLEDCRKLYQLLVTCGANIVDVNFVRKHFSAIKGGRLAELASPARQVTIYVSDAPPGNAANVASGPTMPDESTVEDCYRIIERLGLMSRLPTSIRRMFETGRIPETPKPGAAAFSTSSWHCLLTPEDAMEVLCEEIRGEGWIVEVDRSVDDDCPVPRATHSLLTKLERLNRHYPNRPVAIVSGGELSCPVHGEGVGGRNQAFVLDCVPKIAGRRVAVLSAGTDGVDGISPAAGAVADGGTLERAEALGLDVGDYERRSDSYTFFSRLDDVLMTGPTGNNVRDLRILVAW